MRTLAPVDPLLLGLALAATGCRGGGTGPDSPPGETLAVAGGGHNVPGQYTSDLWVHGTHAYTGTWGGTKGRAGNAVRIWRLGPSGAPQAAGAIEVAGISTVTDVQVSADGSLLIFSAEGGPDAGLFLYALDDPEHPEPAGHAAVATGIHTATLADLGDRRYVFAARNPADPALLIYDVTDPTAPSLAASVPVPANYGIHDTYVRDGIAFVFAWNTGVILYDVGHGMRGGSPADPVEISRLRPSPNGVPGGPAVHNGWWFHDPARGERRYLFLGQEGPGVTGASSSGDIRVIDVSDLARPREVGFFHLDGAGTHNFWMDEARGILYAAYYNAGVVAIDVSGELSGNLGHRLRARVQPGGPEGTFTWGVMLANGYLYASDMLTGFWQLSVD